MLLAKISADFLKILFLRSAVPVVVLRNDFFYLTISFYAGPTSSAFLGSTLLTIAEMDS